MFRRRVDREGAFLAAMGTQILNSCACQLSKNNLNAGGPQGGFNTFQLAREDNPLFFTSERNPFVRTHSTGHRNLDGQ